MLKAKALLAIVICCALIVPPAAAESEGDWINIEEYVSGSGQAQAASGAGTTAVQGDETGYYNALAAYVTELYFYASADDLASNTVYAEKVPAKLRGLSRSDFASEDYAAKISAAGAEYRIRNRIIKVTLSGQEAFIEGVEPGAERTTSTSGDALVVRVDGLSPQYQGSFEILLEQENYAFTDAFTVHLSRQVDLEQEAENSFGLVDPDQEEAQKTFYNETEKTATDQVTEEIRNILVSTSQIRETLAEQNETLLRQLVEQKIQNISTENLAPVLDSRIKAIIAKAYEHLLEMEAAVNTTLSQLNIQSVEEAPPKIREMVRKKALFKKTLVEIRQAQTEEEFEKKLQVLRNIYQEYLDTVEMFPELKEEILAGVQVARAEQAGVIQELEKSYVAEEKVSKAAVLKIEEDSLRQRLAVLEEHGADTTNIQQLLKNMGEKREEIIAAENASELSEEIANAERIVKQVREKLEQQKNETLREKISQTIQTLRSSKQRLDNLVELLKKQGKDTTKLEQKNAEIEEKIAQTHGLKPMIETAQTNITPREIELSNVNETKQALTELKQQLLEAKTELEEKIQQQREKPPENPVEQFFGALRNIGAGLWGN